MRRDGRVVGVTDLQNMPTGACSSAPGKAATWAVRFYERRGFRVVSEEEKVRLLKRDWNIPQRQIEESPVLEQIGL